MSGPCSYAGEYSPELERISVYGGSEREKFFDRHATLKYKYGNRHFGCRGCFVDTVERSQKVIAEYIRSQLVEDMATDKLSQPELFAPFTGKKQQKK